MDEQEIEELRRDFDHFDTDNNGRIDRDEFAKLLDAMGADMSPAELDIGFEFIDEDGNGTIEFDEFLGWWLEQ